MAQGSFHGCCMRMRHRVDAAARPNLYPDWPETPEHASIVVNHTARTHVYLGASAYCFYGSPVLDLGRYVLPSPPIPSLLPSPSFQCGAADFTGRKHHLVCIRSFDSIAALGGAFFFLHTSNIFRARNTDADGLFFFAFLIQTISGVPVRCDVICDCFPKPLFVIRVQASCPCVDFVALFSKIDDAVLYASGCADYYYYWSL
jgi:hypothetical protein